MIAWRPGLPAARGRIEPMADDEQSTPGMIPGPIQEFAAQLRGITEGLEGLASIRDRFPPAPRTFPLPATMSAAQLASIADNIAAQRRSIDALKAQLSSFDEQLAVLEQVLGPLAEWSGKWAELEQRLLNLGGRGPGGSGRP
jgi:hypothetical protein